MTWLTTKKLLHIPTNRTDRYSKQSAQYNYILDWNKFKKDFHCVNQDKLSHSKLKTLIKDHILNKHWKISETFVISNSDIYALPFIFPSILLFLLFTSFYPFYFNSAFFSLHYLLYYYFLYHKFIYYTIKKLTPYNLYNKFYSTLVTPLGQWNLLV